MIANHGEDVAKSWLLGVKSNLARKPQGNDRAQVKAIYAGECDISIGNTYYMAKMLANPEQIEWANSVRIVFPKFSNGGTHMNVSGVAMTKAAPNKDNALKLIEWLSGDTAQKIYAEANGEYLNWNTYQYSVIHIPLVSTFNIFHHILDTRRALNFKWHSAAKKPPAQPGA